MIFTLNRDKSRRLIEGLTEAAIMGKRDELRGDRLLVATGRRPHTVEGAQAKLFASRVARQWTGEAIATATSVLRQVPLPTLGQGIVRYRTERTAGSEYAGMRPPVPGAIPSPFLRRVRVGVRSADRPSCRSGVRRDQCLVQ